MFMIRMRNTLVISSDRLVVCHVGADVVPKKCKSTFHQPSLWVRSFKSGVFLAVQNISKFYHFFISILIELISEYKTMSAIYSLSFLVVIYAVLKKFDFLTDR